MVILEGQGTIRSHRYNFDGRQHVVRVLFELPPRLLDLYGRRDIVDHNAPSTGYLNVGAAGVRLKMSQLPSVDGFRSLLELRSPRRFLLPRCTRPPAQTNPLRRSLDGRSLLVLRWSFELSFPPLPGLRQRGCCPLLSPPLPQNIPLPKKYDHRLWLQPLSRTFPLWTPVVTGCRLWTD